MNDKPQQPAWDLTRVSVLVADDSPHMRVILRTILRTFGVRRVREAEDGGAALKLLAASPPDLVLVDWEMEPMNGLDFMRHLRTPGRGPKVHIPAIMISGYTEQARVLKARHTGADDFLAKPVSASVLYARMLRLIHAPKRLVETADYLGPDRRLRKLAFVGEDRRKAPPAEQQEAG